MTMYVQLTSHHSELLTSMELEEQFLKNMTTTQGEYECEKCSFTATKALIIATAGEIEWQFC